MRVIVAIVFLVLTGAVLTGMGNMGGTPEGAVPNTAENIKVLLVDRTGVSTELSRFSMDGKVFLEGGLGEGTMSVNFPDIKEVNFGTVTGDMISADLQLISGRRLRLYLPKVIVCYGETGIGAYKISVQKISRIVFRK